MSMGLGARLRARAACHGQLCGPGTLLTFWPTSLTCKVGCSQVSTSDALSEPGKVMSP